MPEENPMEGRPAGASDDEAHRRVFPIVILTVSGSLLASLSILSSYRAVTAGDSESAWAAHLAMFVIGLPALIVLALTTHFVFTVIPAKNEYFSLGQLRFGRRFVAAALGLAVIAMLMGIALPGCL